MKRKIPSITFFTSIVLVLPSAAEVIYSGLQDISIPANYDGVFLNVETGAWNTDTLSPQSGWDINPFFGGSVLWNSPAFQPVRSGTDSLDAVLNLAAGTVVNSGSVYSTFVQQTGGQNVGGPGYGGSQTHIGAGVGQFADGVEGYFGFKINGANYGWMRVVFTNNTSGAMIKEWAYENTGAGIAVANIVRSGSNINLDSSSGNFSIGSVLADGTGTANVVKTGGNTASLNAANTYTGTTTVSGGRLNVNGSTNAASTFSVAAATTLGGDGVINGNVTLSGILRAGQGGTTDRSLNIAGVLTANTGSSMVFNIAAENNHDQLIVGSVNLANTNLSIESFTDSSVTELAAGDAANFLTNGASFYKLIEGTTTNMFANTTTLSATELAYFGLTGTQYRFDVGNQPFWVAQGSTYLVAIPEPSVTLLGGLSLLGLALRRRR